MCARVCALVPLALAAISSGLKALMLTQPLLEAVSDIMSELVAAGPGPGPGAPPESLAGCDAPAPPSTSTACRVRLSTSADSIDLSLLKAASSFPPDDLACIYGGDSVSLFPLVAAIPNLIVREPHSQCQ